MKRETVAIRPPFIKLDALLKFSALVGTGGEAKVLIAEGQVLVDGEPCLQRGRKIVPGMTVQLGGTELLVTEADGAN